MRILMGVFLLLGSLAGSACLLVALGCSIDQVSSSSVNGDTTNLRNGRGTATLAGVEIEVEGVVGNGTGITSGTAIKQNAEGFSETEKRVLRFGDFELTLVRKENGPLQLSIGEDAYGEVQAGDKLRVAADRQVTVNGEVRVPVEAAAQAADSDADTESAPEGEPQPGN